MPDSNKNRNRTRGVAAKAVSAYSGAMLRIWDKLQDTAEPLLKYTDPVKKVCYDHLANHYERKYRTKFPKHHSKVFWFDMALLAMLSVLLVIWFFADTLLPLIPTPPLARIDAVSPQAIVSGADTEYVYAYRNDSPKPLGCAVLRVHLPPGTALVKDVADADPTQKACSVDTSMMQALSENARHDILVYSLGTLPPNSRDEVRFIARTFGATGDTSVMSAELLYWDDAATVSSRVSTFDERAITASVLHLDLRLPQNVDRGITREFDVDYANDSGRTLVGTSVRIAVPDDFVISGASPAFGGAKEWRLQDLPAGASGTLRLYGYFRSVPEKLRTASVFTVRGYLREEGQTGNVLAERIRKNADPRAAALSFDAQLIEPDGRQVMLPGETGRVRIRYRNDGAQAITHLRVTLDPGAAYVSEPSPASLSWDEKDTPRLAQIAPGESGELIASFTVKSQITVADLDSAPFPALHIVGRAEYGLGEAEGTVHVDTGTIDIPVATRLGLDAAALYYTKSGDQLGVGPLPPKVGETTKYRVFLTVTTTTGGADGVTVEATLPPNVQWTGRSSVTTGVAMDYLASTRTVRWNLGGVPAYADAEETGIGGSFEVALTPTAADAETVPLLLQNIKITGHDQTTNLTLHASVPDIGTDLPYDRRAAGKGTVLPNLSIKSSKKGKK